MNFAIKFIRVLLYLQMEMHDFVCMSFIYVQCALNGREEEK